MFSVWIVHSQWFKQRFIKNYGLVATPLGHLRQSRPPLSSRLTSCLPQSWSCLTELGNSLLKSMPQTPEWAQCSPNTEKKQQDSALCFFLSSPVASRKELQHRGQRDVGCEDGARRVAPLVGGSWGAVPCVNRPQEPRIAQNHKLLELQTLQAPVGPLFQLVQLLPLL